MIESGAWLKRTQKLLKSYRMVRLSSFKVCLRREVQSTSTKLSLKNPERRPKLANKNLKKKRRGVGRKNSWRSNST